MYKGEYLMFSSCNAQSSQCYVLKYFSIKAVDSRVYTQCIDEIYARKYILIKVKFIVNV